MTDKAQEIADLIEQIESDHEVEIEVTGGGRGWTATAGEMSAKAGSKRDALQALEVLLDDADDDDMQGEHDEIEGCSDECQSSTSNICQCKCDGENHGIAGGVKPESVVVVGDKPCACGCGQSTKRTFVPGHDARFHGLVALIEWGRANGLIDAPHFDGDMGPSDLTEVRKAKAASLRKAARERRATKRTEQEAIAAKMIASIGAPARKTKAQVKADAKAEAETAKALLGVGDLPF